EYPYSRVLDEIAKAGYAGTELGPYGFLPSDAAKLREELNKRSLTLCSAFVAIPLGNRAARSDGLAQVLTTARLVSAVGCRLLILSDEISAERCAVAGRRDEANRLSWTEAEWKDVFPAVSEVVDRSREFGVRLAFHHHVGTHVETPEEVDRLLTSFSPSDLGLCLDTGHCVYGGGEPAQLLERYADRIHCVHFKDIDPERLEDASRQQLDFYEAVNQGVFAYQRLAVVDFAKILAGSGVRANHRASYSSAERDQGRGPAKKETNSIDAGRKAGASGPGSCRARCDTDPTRQIGNG